MHCWELLVSAEMAAAMSAQWTISCLHCPSIDVLHRCICREGQLQRVHHVLNECLVDRGASPNMVNLEAYIDGHHITTVQASSPTDRHVAPSLFRCDLLPSAPNTTG